MKGTLAVAAAMIALAGCTSPDTVERTAENPHHYCRGQGLSFGTVAFERCVDTAIAERCAPTGARSEQCATRLRQATFLAQQLELQGYRLFGQSS